MTKIAKEIKDMRGKIISFLESKGGMAVRSEIRKFVGLTGPEHSEVFYRATKSKKLIPIYGTGEISPGLFLGRPPILAFKLSD